MNLLVHFFRCFEESYPLQSCKKFELSPKASFGISNDFECEFCSGTFKFVERTHENITYTSFVSQTKLIKTIIKICFVWKELVNPKKQSQN